MFLPAKMLSNLLPKNICRVSIVRTTRNISPTINRASFFNASARTADGFVGLIFRRDPTFKLPEKKSGVGAALAEFVEDADMLGTSLTAFSKKLVTEIIGVGRAGTLVDWNEEAEQRAYAVPYSAENIINWHTERVNGRNVLTLVVLKEVSQTPAAEPDPFEPEEIQQLRVLKLVPPQAATGTTNPLTGLTKLKSGNSFPKVKMQTGLRNAAKRNGSWWTPSRRCAWGNRCR